VPSGGGDDDDGDLVDHRRQPPPPMEIGWPTDVRHVAHVTFDRFHGFRGVPEELRPEVELSPSASKTVFGVSTESMQCSYDARGNSVPTILLHLQRRLYDQGGLAAEGLFSSGSPPTPPRSSAPGTTSTPPASCPTASTSTAWRASSRRPGSGSSPAA